MYEKPTKLLKVVSNPEFRNLHFAIQVGLCSALSYPIGESVKRIEGPVKKHIHDCFNTAMRTNPQIQGTLNDLYMTIIEGNS